MKYLILKLIYLSLSPYHFKIHIQKILRHPILKQNQLRYSEELSSSPMLFRASKITNEKRLSLYWNLRKRKRKRAGGWHRAVFGLFQPLPKGMGEKETDGMKGSRRWNILTRNPFSRGETCQWQPSFVWCVPQTLMIWDLCKSKWIRSICTV